MELPGPPLHLHTLQPSEIEKLRKILQLSKKSGYFQQKNYIGNGVDIRNFLDETSLAPAVNGAASPAIRRNKRAHRTSPQLLSRLYDFVMTELPPKLARCERDDAIANAITELYEMGIKSGRYSRDISFYMDSVIDGDMKYYNVKNQECGVYIGYRFRSDHKTLIKFLVQIFHDPDIDRTRFGSFFYLGNLPRQTNGFAYSGAGNIYLSGFINGNLGCEFFALRSRIISHVYSGVVTTTDINGMPSSKQCVLVDASATIYKEMIPEGKMARISINDPIIDAMIPITGNINDEMVEIGRNKVPIANIISKTAMLELPSTVNAALPATE